jgi:hypothetical protein
LDSDLRPTFARAFPRAAELDALVDAFGRGDYARVRIEGSKLAETTNAEDVRRAARTLVARTNPDPLAVWLLVLAGALLVVLSGYWIVQEHVSAPHDGQPRAPMSQARLIPEAT